MLRSAALSPFKHRTFAVMWCVALVSNLGMWINSVGAGWLMTNLSPSPLFVSLVQAASTLPFFLFALPAGALADLFNRRSILLITNVLLMITASLFVLLVWQEQVNVYILLVYTFLLGAGGAFMTPPWQAVIPRMVPSEDLPQAIALGSIGVNIARAVGPAIAGFAILYFGIGSPFFLNAVSYIFIIVALIWWKYRVAPANHQLPPEHVFSAMKTGLRYAVYSDPLKRTMLHIVCFMFFANAFWGLLPLITKDLLGGGSGVFGAIMGMMGLGAVVGAFVLPQLKQKLIDNQIVALGTVGTSLVMLVFGVHQELLSAMVLSFVFGFCWVLVLATVSVAAQKALPEWVRARGLAVFMMSFFGAMSLGTAFWGWIAEHTSIVDTLIYASIAAVIAVFLVYRVKLIPDCELDFTPAQHWAEPIVNDCISHDDGPVMITVEYQIPEANRQKFMEAIYEVKSERKRNGAYRWGIFENTEVPGHFFEYFMEDSWSNHLRHHERITESEKSHQEYVRSLSVSGGRPRVQHLIAANKSKAC